MTRIYLSFPAGPNLPVAPGEWNEQYQNQFSNILRLYFNQLSGLLRELGNTQGGYHLNFPYGAFHQDGVTTLSSNISNVSTTPISVASTESFPASGWILIESEIISYSGKTATTFTGITRGVLGTTNVAHTAGAAISEVQGTGSSTTIGQVLFNNTDYSNGVYTLASDYSKIYFDKDGIYNIQISVQLLNFTTSEDNVTMWFALNGNNLDNTASIEQVNSKHGSNPGAAILTFNIFQQVRGGDYIQIKWTSNSGNTVVATYPAGTSPVRPVSPAIILTASFVSSSVNQ
jgi:hypothetical protein